MKKIFIAFLVLAFGCVFAQSGSLDASFNVADSGNGFGDGANNTISKALKLSDGKILLVGNFTQYNQTAVNRIVKINTDGSVDSSFNVGSGADAYVYTATEQADGKILIGGNFNNYNGVAKYKLARLNADGSLDATFSGTGTGPNNLVNNILALPTGKILISGTFSLYNDDYTAIKIARLNADGSFDSSFLASPGAGVSNSSISNVYYDAPNQNYYVVGSFTGFNGATGVTIKNLVKLNDSGIVDTTFNTGSGFNFSANSINMQNDGKLLIGGSFSSFNGTAVQNLIRLTPDGNLDPTFNNTNSTTGGVYEIKIVGNNIFIGGNFTTYSGYSAGRFAKLSADGIFDNTFNTGQTGATGSVSNILINTDGSFFISGSFNAYNDFNANYFSHINSDGSVDHSYNLGTGSDGAINAIAVQSDKKILIAGAQSSFNGVISARLTRLNSNGTLDTTFNSSGTGANGTLNALAIQPDGKILVGGTFTKYNGNTVSNFIRVNPDGSENSFLATGNAFNNSVSSIAIQNDGKILVGGSFTSYGTTSINRLIRFNTDGTIDAGFSIGTGASSATVTAIKQLSDGKILIAGSFTNFNGKTGKVVRLNADGSLDATFTGGVINFPVYAMDVQTDGKIVIGGNFTLVNGSTSTRVARLNADGTTDTTFIPSPTAGIVDSAVLSLALQADKKIILAGLFTKYNTTSANRLMRLNEDGSLDTTFDVGTGGNNTINYVKLDADGKALIGGLFTNFNGIGKNRIARVFTSNGGLAVDNSASKSEISIYPNPVLSDLHIKTGKKIKDLQIFDVSGKRVYQTTQTDLNLNFLLKGIYIITITTSDNKIEIKKIIKK